MAEKLTALERFRILRKIGHLRAEYLYLGLKELHALLHAKLDEIIKIRVMRARVGAEIVELRKKYDESKREVRDDQGA